MVIIVEDKSPDRVKIVMDHLIEVKCWIKKLGIPKAQLQTVIDKVGNDASAVQKELANHS